MIPKPKKFHLSYSKTDALARRFVEALTKNLDEIGVMTSPKFIDSSKHEHINRTIRRSIDQASAIVAIISDETLLSPWFNFELGAAMSTNKQILPVFLSKHAKRMAPSYLAKMPGLVVAHGLKPEFVVERLVKSVEAMRGKTSEGLIVSNTPWPSARSRPGSDCFGLSKQAKQSVIGRGSKR